MYATILDSNTLRGIGDDAFSALVAAERRAGILQLADTWTLIELLAHLGEPEADDYWPSRRGIRRAARRSLNDAEPRIAFPPEVEIARVLFASDPPDLRDSIAAIIDTCSAIGKAEDSDDLRHVEQVVREMQTHVRDREVWFAAFLGDLREKLENVPFTAGEDTRTRRAETRAFLTSDVALRLDAAALISRAHTQMGREVPDPIPDDMITKVQGACRAGLCAMAELLARVLCDGASLEKKRTRNLLWDQEIAFQVGQDIGGLPVMLVSDDAYFRQSVKGTQFESSICSKNEYQRLIGLPAL